MQVFQMCVLCNKTVQQERLLLCLPSLYFLHTYTFSFTCYFSHHKCTRTAIKNESLEITILLAITTIFEPISVE